MFVARFPVRQLVWAAGLLLGIWILGLACFAVGVFALRDNRAENTEAVVVLTGGRQRLEAGLELMLAGKARTLFVSGVNQHVDRDELLRAMGPQAERFACCILLGHDADSTLGNARETAVWMKAVGYRTLRLVTSWYHMPRSLLEFRRAMPEVTIIAHPVFAHTTDAERWSSWHSAPLLVLIEYHKFLGAWLRPLWAAVSDSPRSAAPSRDASVGPEIARAR